CRCSMGAEVSPPESERLTVELTDIIQLMISPAVTTQTRPTTITIRRICLRWRRSSTVTAATASGAIGFPQAAQKRAPSAVDFPQWEQNIISVEGYAVSMGAA
ncbi:MAG: hypothetical protein ABSD96_11710, partial [Candidatus Korobacteraceae bacterium]